jgi:site-specific DNA recombinase
VRSLIEQARIVPTDSEVTIELKGELAGILVLAEGAKQCSGGPEERALQIKMVAGVGFEPTTFRL